MLPLVDPGGSPHDTDAAIAGLAQGTAGIAGGLTPHLPHPGRVETDAPNAGGAPIADQHMRQIERHLAAYRELLAARGKENGSRSAV